MIYSLFNKFQGAWLGSVVATARFRAKSQPNSQVNSPPNPPSNSSSNPWEQIATIGIQSLIQQGYLELNHWQAQIATTNPDLLKLVGTATASEAVWATLPVSLFYHEHYTTTKLLSALDLWLAPEESPHLGLAMGEAIALLLDQDFYENFPQGFNHNSQSGNSAPRPLPIAFQQLLSRTLPISPSFWGNLPCLEIAIKVINSLVPTSQVPLAISCYCFLSTPEDFTLSIHRAAATPQPEMAIAFTGFLSGAYNTLRGIPLSWQTQVNSGLNSGFNSGLSHYQLVDRLFATWSGVYHHYRPQGNFQYPPDSSPDNSPEAIPETQQWQIAKSPAKPLVKIPSKSLSKNRKKS
ncbi:MAG: hypothetical protein HC916_07325 [Coleofasciculaceae cyanobacterium SM2_1_6]|nr:hypothetical protein [Coleofasciculaceae cyanobacterium SM2_1_6]